MLMVAYYTMRGGKYLSSAYGVFVPDRFACLWSVLASCLGYVQPTAANFTEVLSHNCLSRDAYLLLSIIGYFLVFSFKRFALFAL